MTLFFWTKKEQSCKTTPLYNTVIWLHNPLFLLVIKHWFCTIFVAAGILCIMAIFLAAILSSFIFTAGSVSTVSVTCIACSICAVRAVFAICIHSILCHCLYLLRYFLVTFLLCQLFRKNIPPIIVKNCFINFYKFLIKK